jgi:NhaP-type Na+/H+ or K+/H+ antiporter
LHSELIVTVTLVAVLGIGAQWIAWKLHWPAIVMMALAGVLAGPVTGIIDPQADFGELLRPIIAVSVAVILFEGGLHLDLHELRGLTRSVWRLIVPGVPIAWALGSIAGHYIAGLSWPVAILFGGILVVTGPTVIIPLLRQAKLASRPGAILKWEGIVNDPIGALLAVFVFEYLAFAHTDAGVAETVGQVVLGAVLAGGIGFLAGRGIAWAFSRGFVPEYLKAAALLTSVLVTYVGANAFQKEAGLLAVTAFGMTLANARLASIAELRRFKEYVTIILVSAVFVLLSATLSIETVTALDWRAAVFVAVMLLAVRPAAVWLSTIGTGLSWQERLFLGWIAPRGIVAVAVTGFFGPELVRLGFEDAALLVPLAFAVVFATVTAHGFSIGWIGRRLGLSASGPPGVLIVGATPWSVALAQALQKQDVPVTVTDASWHRLREARLAGVPVYYGEILSENAEFHLDVNRFGALLALTENDAYNALVCSSYAAELGRHRVFQLAADSRDEDDPHSLANTVRGRSLLRSGLSVYELIGRQRQGWVFTRTKLSDAYGLEDWDADRQEGATMVGVIRADGEVDFATAKGGRPAVGAGDMLLAFGPPDRDEQPAAETTSAARLPG